MIYDFFGPLIQKSIKRKDNRKLPVRIKAVLPPSFHTYIFKTPEIVLLEKDLRAKGFKQEHIVKTFSQGSRGIVNKVEVTRKENMTTLKVHYIVVNGHNVLRWPRTEEARGFLKDYLASATK